MSSTSHRKLSELTDAELLEELDDLVVHAIRGDRYALTVLSVGLGPVFLDEARTILGPGREEHAGGIVAELFTGMLRGELSFAPGAIRAGPWLGAQLEQLAHPLEAHGDYGFASISRTCRTVLGTLCGP